MAGDITAESLSLSARDTSAIFAEAGAASIAGSYGGTAGVAVSIGVSLARNNIDNTVEAYINSPHLVETTVGGVSLTAEEAASIRAVSVAASLAAGFGGTGGIAVSGAGAEATNSILGKTNAYLLNSRIDSQGDVLLNAGNSASLNATVVGVSAAVSGGGAVGVGVSIGAAVARNLIGDGITAPIEVLAYSENSSILAGGSLTQSATSSQSIFAGVGAGSAAIAVGGTVGVGASGAGVFTENKVSAHIKAYH